MTERKRQTIQWPKGNILKVLGNSGDSVNALGFAKKPKQLALFLFYKTTPTSC
jgi:hypothetical protein